MTADNMKITAGSAPGPTRSTKSFLGSERFRKLCLPAASRQAERLFDEEPDCSGVLRQELIPSCGRKRTNPEKSRIIPWIIWKCSIPVRTVRTPDMSARKNATASGRKRSNFSILPQDFNLCWKKRTFPPCPMTSMMRHRGLPCRPSSGPVRNMP